MSTLKCTTLSKQDGSASVPVDTVVNGSAKAWVYFNAATGVPIIGAAFNVSSITDNGVGDYTANFTAVMPDANYATTGTCSNNGDTATASARAVAVRARLNSSVRVVNTVGTGGALDFMDQNIAVFR